MKKIFLIILAFCITILCICIGKIYIKKRIISNIDKIIYANVIKRNELDYVMENILDENSILVLGSSELSSNDNIAYPNYLYNGGKSDYKIVPVGRGNNQSLFHTIGISALSNNIKNNKVVLIVSPQWFTKINTTSQMFSSRFSERMYVEFLRNTKININNKKKIANKVEALLESDLPQQKRVKEMNSIYLYNNINIIKRIKYNIYNKFMDLKSLYEFWKSMDEYYNTKTRSNEIIRAADIDYNRLMLIAEETGEKEATNNDFGIKDSYFDTYVKENLESKKDSQIKDSYIDSPEYDDLKMFFDVCKDLNLDVMVVSVPVNGLWYDYTGFPKNDRLKYYENIRNICKEYNVKLADFSDKEYEKYFLRDIMHVGWKGWVYIDDAIYKFYQE